MSNTYMVCTGVLPQPGYTHFVHVTTTGKSVLEAHSSGYLPIKAVHSGRTEFFTPEELAAHDLVLCCHSSQLMDLTGVDNCVYDYAGEVGVRKVPMPPEGYVLVARRMVSDDLRTAA